MKRRGSLITPRVPAPALEILMSVLHGLIDFFGVSCSLLTAAFIRPSAAFMIMSANGPTVYAAAVSTGYS